MRWMAALALVAGCGNTQNNVTPQSTATVTMATWNLYLGADLTVLTNAMGNTAPAVAQVWNAVKATDPVARMDAVASQLAARPPDLVALQEVALWRTQTPADGTATAATDVAFDFLQLLIDDLSSRGLTYTAMPIATNADVEATGEGDLDVRFTDRDVILVRQGFNVTSVEQNHFETTLTVSGFTVTRGWVAVRTPDFRFMNTHLESASNAIRDAQAAQLLVDTADTTPLILTGDFNFDSSSLPYGTFKTAQLNDSVDAGPTCCQDADLRNADSKLTQRIDLVWTRGDFSASQGELMGENPADRTRSGLWPSDHAGVRATLSP